jgi:hypothetical protein
MPLFELAACVAATAVFAVYKCFPYCISSCNHDDGNRRYGRSYSASSTNYGSITTQPVARPYPTPRTTNTRGSYTRSKSKIKTLPNADHDSNPSYPTRSHISQHHRPPPRLSVVPQYSAALAVRTHCIHGVPTDLTLALQSTSSGDPHSHGRPRECEAICKAPLASLTNLPNLESGEGDDVKGITTAKDLRKQARHMTCKMWKARKQAGRLRREGNQSASKEQNRDALEHRSAIRDLNKMAAAIIFKDKNKVRWLSVLSPRSCMFRLDFLPPCQGQSEGTVDLHGLHVSEALEYAKQELQSATLRADRTVHFIVGTSTNGLFDVSLSTVVLMGGVSCCLGKGLHSKAGEPRIRPALIRLCNEYVNIPDFRILD